MSFAALGHYLLIETLLSAGLLLLNTRVLGRELGSVVGTHHLLQQGTLPFLSSQSGAIKLSRAGDDLANMRILGRTRSEGLLLVLGIQDASHA